MRTGTCEFALEPGGFVRATVAPGADFDLVAAREALDATWEVAGRQRRPVLVDMRLMRSQTREARRHFASGTLERCTAVALLVGNPVSRVIANFFVQLTEQVVPTQLFSDEAAAVRWLLKAP